MNCGLVCRETGKYLFKRYLYILYKGTAADAIVAAKYGVPFDQSKQVYPIAHT